MTDREKELINKIEIPVFPGIKVNNSTVICLDKNIDEDELNINYVEDNTVKTEVFNLFEADDITNCLNDILSVNSGITIDKVTYFEEFGIRKLVIHSNKKLNTKYYQNKFKIENFRNSRSNKYYWRFKSDVDSDVNTMLEGIDNVLNQNQYCPKNAISVAELLKVYSLYIKNFIEQKESVINDFKYKVKNLYNDTDIKISDCSIKFDFNKRIFCFQVCDYSGWCSRTVADIEFQLDKKSNKIIPIKALDQEGLKIYHHLKDDLPNLFKIYLDNKSLLNSEFHITIPTINSDYIITLNNDNICATFKFEKYKKLLNIIHNVEDIKKFTYKYEDISLLERVLLDNNLENLYNNTFVKIEDCPEFLQEKLYELEKSTKSIRNIDNIKVVEKPNVKQKLKSLFNK